LIDVYFSIRKENLARIKAEVDEEERKIALAIRELKASK